MQNSYFQDEYFGSVDFNKIPVQKGDYDNCTFENCIFSGAFKPSRFEHCKLIGLQFDECNPFLLALHFIGCQLNLSCFYQLKIKNTIFKECILKEVDFTETDLSGSSFSKCNLSGAIFGNTNLEKADFSSSLNFLIDPDHNRIKGAMFTLDGLPGLLNKYQIRVQ